MRRGSGEAWGGACRVAEGKLSRIEFRLRKRFSRRSILRFTLISRTRPGHPAANLDAFLHNQCFVLAENGKKELRLVYVSSSSLTLHRHHMRFLPRCFIPPFPHPHARSRSQSTWLCRQNLA